jgi:threonine/homoserine/homoserine lactone efflux protein
MSFTTLSWTNGRNLLLKYSNSTCRSTAEAVPVDIGAYFTILIYVLMAATGIALALIFLYMFYGEEEKKE